jgi:hypothetical protein
VFGSRCSRLGVGGLALGCRRLGGELCGRSVKLCCCSRDREVVNYKMSEKWVLYVVEVVAE